MIVHFNPVEWSWVYAWPVLGLAAPAAAGMLNVDTFPGLVAF